MDNDIRDAVVLLKTNQYARRSFLEFVEGKTWAETLDQGRAMNESHDPETIWKRFGYKDPFIAADITTSLSSSSFSSPRNADAETVVQAGDSTCTAVPDVVGSRRKWSVFDHRELRAVLCFVLWPLYRNSSAYRALHEPLSTPTHGSASEATSLSSSQKLRMSIARFSRLRELLLGTVALMDMKNFNRYLADPAKSWIEDFKSALLNLPLTLLVSEVQAEKRRSQVAFINNDPHDNFSCKWSQQDPLSWSGAVGRDLHVLCAVDLPSECTKQVETAIFNAKTHKVAMTDGKACKLRAVKPIFAETGEYMYAVALETAFFENPAQLQELGMFVQSEKPFQQIEDLLALLPVLIKV